ncbi:pol [Symbiodinium sp. KB8]|nr:pol [Symbiodinium sp. KB8]
MDPGGPDTPNILLGKRSHGTRNGKGGKRKGADGGGKPQRTNKDEEANHSHKKILLNKTMVTTTKKYPNKFQNWKKLANHKGGTINSKANAKGEIRQLKVKFEKSSANGAYTNPTATLGTKWPTGWIWYHSTLRGMEARNPLHNSREVSRRGTKRQPIIANDMKLEKEETYVMNNPETHGRHQHRGMTWEPQGTKPQQNIENDMKPDKEETIPGRPQRDLRRRGEDLQKLHDRNGVFNHFTYSWGGYSPPLTWPPELPLSGTTHLHLRYLAHGIWVGEVVARGSELTPPYGRVPDRGFARVRQTSRRGEREGFIPQGTAFELIPVGLVYRNLEPEQWVLRIRNLPPSESRDPAGAPLKARKYLLTWRPKTTSCLLGDLTEEEGDAYRASAMARGPPVPDMSALAHELDCLNVSPERYMDVRIARAKTQFPQEDPYQPRGGRRGISPPCHRHRTDNQGIQQGDTGTTGGTQQASASPTETQPQQAQVESNTSQQPRSTPPAATKQGVSFYSREARTAFHVEWGGETPQQHTPPRTETQVPKAPPPQALQGSEQTKLRAPRRGDPLTPTRHHLEIDDGFEKNNSRRINPAQMAATLVEIVRHILRDTLHATSVRTELAEVGELLEDVVADFGASIRLRDSAGIAEGRDALMEAVDILDHIVLNYDSEQDEFTMDPETLQDELLRLAQQLQIVVPAHDNLLGDIRGELPSQRPASNSQELFEGYGDEMGLMQLHRPGTNPSGDTEEGHRCAIQLLSLLEREFPESYRTNGQCEADAIWLLLRGERLAEYIDGMNIPAAERVRGGEDEHPGLAGTFQNHEGNARASQLLEAIESETQATADYALNAEERGSQQRANYAAEAMELITEAMGLADDVGIPGVVDYLAAAATNRCAHGGDHGRKQPAAEQPSMAELLEVLELVQAGMALLTRGRHSYNWQVTHWATDAAEEALALLSVATATDDPNELGRTPPQLGDLLPRLRNLLDEAATGIGVLVGIYPHWGENEYIHPADTIAQNQQVGEQTLRHPNNDPPDALHVYKAQRALRQLHPFLEGPLSGPVFVQRNHSWEYQFAQASGGGKVKAVLRKVPVRAQVGRTDMKEEMTKEIMYVESSIVPLSVKVVLAVAQEQVGEQVSRLAQILLSKIEAIRLITCTGRFSGCYPQGVVDQTMAELCSYINGLQGRLNSLGGDDHVCEALFQHGDGGAMLRAIATPLQKFVELAFPRAAPPALGNFGSRFNFEYFFSERAKVVLERGGTVQPARLSYPPIFSPGGICSMGNDDTTQSIGPDVAYVLTKLRQAKVTMSNFVVNFGAADGECGSEEDWNADPANCLTAEGYSAVLVEGDQKFFESLRDRYGNRSDVSMAQEPVEDFIGYFSRGKHGDM